MTKTLGHIAPKRRVIYSYIIGVRLLHPKKSWMAESNPQEIIISSGLYSYTIGNNSVSHAYLYSTFPSSDTLLLILSNSSTTSPVSHATFTL